MSAKNNEIYCTPAVLLWQRDPRRCRWREDGCLVAIAPGHVPEVDIDAEDYHRSEGKELEEKTRRQCNRLYFSRDQESKLQREWRI